MIESKGNKDLEKRIDLYVNGKLDVAQTDELWAELIQDDYYLDYMKSVVNLKSVLDRKKKPAQPAHVYKFQHAYKYVAAAAVLLIVSIAGVINLNPGDTAAPVNPIAHIGLDVVRNTTGVSEVVTNEVIKKAIKLASEGDVEQAISILKDELDKSTNPQNIADIALSLGSIQYNAGKYPSSIENFELIIQQENIKTLTLEKGYWFLGNAYFQLDQLVEAENAFQKAYDLNGAYSRVAKTYIDALKNLL